MNRPARVQSLIDRIAEKHEVSADDILSRNATRPVEQARIECYLTLLAEPKANGIKPTKAEVARWMDRDHATISLAVKNHELKMELLEEARL